MKKLFAVLVALALVLTMGTTFAFAAEKGTITIENAVVGAEYNVYKMLNFEPSNDDGSKGVYTIEPGWENFFASADAQAYFDVVTNGEKTTVSLKSGVTAVDQALAQAALAYAKDAKNGISAAKTGSISKDDSTAERGTVTIEGLDLGYYAIDTTVGTMGALTRASNELKAVEKNEKPSIDKLVQEDKDDSWGKVNDADISQEVNYKSTITVGLGAVNYIMHDTMEEGLTFIPDSVVITDSNGKELTAGVDYTVYEGGYKADGHTFDIVFADSYISTLKQGDTITVEYSATLNDDAVIGNVDNGNENEVYLSCGEKSEWETEKQYTSTFTWEIDISKIDGETKEKLAGAEFQLVLKKTVDGEEVESFVKFEETAEGSNIYKVVATDAAENDEGTVITTDATGEFNIEGLDEGKYYLRETKAPEGDNMLADAVTISIESQYVEADRTASYTVDGETPATIEVENNTGELLPETGGIGTTIFYVVGGLLMLAAFVVLVSKKRMATFA